MKEIDVIILDGYYPVLKTIEDSIDGFHKAINCRAFEAYTATQIGLELGLDIYIDETGKFDQSIITGLFVRDNKVIDFLCGNVLICRHDEEGESISATAEDLASLIPYFIDGTQVKLPPKMAERWKVGECLLMLKC